MATKAEALEMLDKEETVTGFTLDEVRHKNNINIVLPYVGGEDDPDHFEQYEFVTVDGRTTQIRKGEVVGVNWIIYNALKQSNKYKDMRILA